MILVTNDDGIVAPGIRALVEIAKEFGDVLVVAPDSPQSGQGHAITLNNPLKLRKVDIFEGIDAYECSGTPVDCVKLAKNVLMKGRKIDLCVSGINHGANSSINIIYSGTMSAAMEASLEGIDSIGFSLLDYSFQADFEPAKVYIRKIIASVLADPLPSCKLLNVNIPACPVEDIKGIKVCRQGDGTWVEDFQEGTDPRGEKYYWLTGKFVSNENDNQDNDIYALKNNYISVVPSTHDLTYHADIKNLKYLEKI
jgi:5'-nucleotidase